MNILQEIADCTRERILEKKRQEPFEKIREMALEAAHAIASDSVTIHSFEHALKGDDIALICEIKKASPSKGIIAEDFPYRSIAKEYEEAGAAVISVLTEPCYFKGSDRYLKEISEVVSIPLLRKDFTVDPYMIYEAKVLGASAVLLICSILDKDTLMEYLETAHSLGLSALVETHDEAEVEMALSVGARIIGVNNRDLKTFNVDLNVSERLRKMVSMDKVFVSESGIRTSSDIAKLRKMKADAALIGETIMRSSDKKAEILQLRSCG